MRLLSWILILRKSSVIYNQSNCYLHDTYLMSFIVGLMKLADSYLDTGLRRKCEKVLIRSVNLGNVLFLMRNSGSANAQVKILSIS